jgi:hypothetical protein
MNNTKLNSKGVVLMDKYKCHKEVHAKPMNRGDYNSYCGKDSPKGKDPLDEGYLVVYGMGTPEHYESWSPKKQFDEGYNEMKLKD